MSIENKIREKLGLSESGYGKEYNSIPGLRHNSKINMNGKVFTVDNNSGDGHTYLNSADGSWVAKIEHHHSMLTQQSMYNRSDAQPHHKVSFSKDSGNSWTDWGDVPRGSVQYDLKKIF